MLLRFILAWLICAGWPSTAAAQAQDTATLTVFNHNIITFRASLGARSARERAEAGARLLSQSLDTAGAGVTSRPVPEGALLFAGNRAVFTITPNDVDTLAGERFADVVARTITRTRVALDAGAEQRSFSAILRGVIVSLVATSVFIILLRLLRVGRRIAHVRFLRASRESLRHLSIAGYKLVDTERVLAIARRSMELVTWSAALVLAYLWLTLVLTQFAYSRPWGNALGHYLRVTLAGLLTGVINAIPGLFTIVIIMVLTRFIARVLGTIFDAVESSSLKVSWLHPDTVMPTRRIVIAVLWLLAIAAAYPYLPGAESEAFKGISVFAGLIIALGSTGVVGQAMSGLVLMYSRAFKIGEYVQVGSTEGSVVDLGLLSTKIHTPKGELVTLPNAVVVGTSTKNYSRFHETGELVLYTNVTIGYDTPWRQVHGLLVDAALRTAGVLREPQPFVMQTALSDFYVEYQLNVYVADPVRRMSVLAALHENIQDCFNEHGVQIMSPHFRSQPGEPVTVPRDRWYAPPARLDVPGRSDGSTES